MIDSQLTSGGPLLLVEQLAVLVRRRVEDEQAITDAHALRTARAENDREHRRGEISRKFDARRAAAAQPQAMQAEVLKQYDAERTSVEERLHKASRKMRRRYRQRLKTAKKKRDRIHAGETARFAGRERSAEQHVGNYGEITALRRVAMAELAEAADKLLAQRGFAPPTSYESSDEATFDRDNHELFASAMQRGAAALAAMRNLKSVRLAGAHGLLAGFGGGAICGALVAGALWGAEAWPWIAGAGVLCGVAASLIVNRAAAPLARKQTLAHWSLVRGALAAAHGAAAAAFVDAKDDAQKRLEALAEKRDRKIHKAEAARTKDASTTKATLERKLAANAEKVAVRLARMERERDSAIASATGGLPQRLAQLDEQREAAYVLLDEDHAVRLAESASQRDDELAEVASDWCDALRRWEASLATFDAWCRRHFPPWEETAAKPAAHGACDGVRFGEYLVSPSDLLPQDSTLHVPDWAKGSTYAIPALVSFHERPALVVAAGVGGRLRGADVAYNVALRVIATLSAENVRCTVLDPAGVGVRFARLNNLCDADEPLLLVASTDWQIEEALQEHQAHIERVRRSTSDAIEPQRVLVVLGATDVPQQAALLRQIVAQGACGGVLTILSVDGDAPQQLGELERDALTIIEVDGDYRLQHVAGGTLRTTFDEAPSAAVAAEVVRCKAPATNGRAGSSVYAAARR